MGVPVECIRKAIAEFKAVEHRIEFVREVHGVRYYNDSKGTNPDAAIKAVQAMVTPTVVIGGGYDKQSSYEEWIDSFGDTVKCLVLLGATADKIEATARKAGFTNIIRVASLEEAVKVSAAQAQSGEAVLFRRPVQAGICLKAMSRGVPCLKNMSINYNKSGRHGF